MGVIADVSAPEVGFEFEGRGYTLQELTMGMEGELERWAQQQALLRVEQAPLKSEAERTRLRERTLDAIAAGTFDYGSESFNRGMATVRGAVQVLKVRLRRHHPDIDEEHIRRMLTRCAPLAALLKAESPNGEAKATP